MIFKGVEPVGNVPVLVKDDKGNSFSGDRPDEIKTRIQDRVIGEGDHLDIK